LVLDKWCDDWQVPPEYREYWRNQISIKVTDIIGCPALTFDDNGKRALWVRPEWLNCGVIAHEQAHNAYALLTITDKANFIIDLQPLLTDPLIKRLSSLKQHYFIPGKEVEAHAEIYRFIGQSMPEDLKKYYPKLF
jgi:hypothetical protein